MDINADVVQDIRETVDEVLEQVDEVIGSIVLRVKKGESDITSIVPKDLHEWYAVREATLNVYRKLNMVSVAWPASYGTKTTCYGIDTLRSVFYVPVLKALVKMGGKGRTNDVIPMIYDELITNLNDEYLEIIPSRNEPRWRHALRFARRAMINDKLLKGGPGTRISPDYWEITNRGMKFLKERGD